MAESASPERPLSPHLQIWRWTAVMAASITHRGTGIILYGGTFLLVCWLALIELNPSAFGRAAAFVNSPVGFIIVAGYVWSLAFHLMNGLRHLYWDAGRGLAPKTATMTAWFVYIAATILAVFILWAGYAQGSA